jgi:fatty-acyl-CoA synthase
MVAGEWETPRSLLGWLREPGVDRGLYVLEESWERHAYEDVAAAALGTSATLRDVGTVTGDVVAVTATEPLQFMTGFYGALHAGATPLPIAPPTLLGARYVERVASLLTAAPPRAVITTASAQPDVAAAIDRAGIAAEIVVETANGGREQAAPPSPLALLQFTSGSTGEPRPVEISWANLEANMNLIRRWLELTSDDSVASWLPLYHDMGLIGTFLTAVASDMDAWIMRPEQFVLKPRRWLECFGREAVTIASSPPFGYSYAARRLAHDALDGFDLSPWRAAVVGAERLDPCVLQRFLAFAEPYGFRPDTFRPAYGLAEATLAVTGQPLRSTPRVLAVDWVDLRVDHPVSIEGSYRLDVEVQVEAGGLVSSGRPLHPQQVAVVDVAGRPLPEGWLGEVVVEGPCVAGGYRAPADEPVTRIEEGRLMTGDAGFFHDGDLFVLGRMVDSFTVHGRQVYAESVEASLASLTGLPVDRCVVVPSQAREGDRLVAVVECSTTPWIDELVTLLRAEAGNALGVLVYAARRNAIPRTTSGKPRRRMLRQMVEADELDAALVYTSLPGQLATPVKP